MFSREIERIRLEVIDILSIDIDLLIQKIDEVNQQIPEYHKPLNEERKFLLCLYLRGYSSDRIIQKYQSLGLKVTKHDISNRMRNVIEGIKKLIHNNISDWTIVINYLLEYGYKITNNNIDNCLSLGGRYFLANARSLEAIQTTQKFLLQDYPSALAGFLQLWDEGDRHGETLIYLNNSWLLANQNILKQEYGIASFHLYKIAVVIPVLYNNGSVAQNLLKGIATLQLKINLNLSNNNNLYYPLAENLREIEKFKFNNRQKFGLLVYIAQDDRDLENPQSKTAIAIQNIDDIMGVIGHYSSEATANALKIYATSNIPLITASAASNNLPGNWERANNLFYRVNTKDEIQAATLARFINEREPQAKLAIMYNSCSDYCCSFKKSFLKYFSGKIILNYENLSSNNYDELQATITEAQKRQVNVILLIPDGGIHLASLSLAGSIIRQILESDCWLVGGSTLIHQDILEWVREASKRQKITKNLEKIVISCPWFPDEQNHNSLAQQFCQESQLIWQEAINTWREGTAYDSALMLAKAIDKFNSQGGGDRYEFTQVLQEFKQNNNYLGVTGNLQFDRFGDRLEPPVKLVGVVRENNNTSNQIKYCFRSL
ncbi:MAG: ABC transporter substrate-binding protein [Xenococcaceae cyanobacterium]